MAANVFPCEQLVYVGRRGGWAECRRMPARMVTFPRTPPMILCEEHEREATDMRAELHKSVEKP